MDNNHIAISNLIAIYAEYFDSGAFEHYGALFTHDGTLRLSTSAKGACGPLQISAAGRNGARLYEDGTPRTRHMVANLCIEIDSSGTTAASRSCFTVFQATAELPLQAIASGRYQDRFRCVDGTWLFESRVVFVDFAGDLSHHLIQKRETP